MPCHFLSDLLTKDLGRSLLLTMVVTCFVCLFHVCLSLVCCLTTAWVPSAVWQQRLDASLTSPSPLRTLVSTPRTVGHSRRYSYRSWNSALSAMTLPWPAPGNTTTMSTVVSQDRFDRSASTVAATDQPCILTLYGGQYNLTAWAQAHPGGVNVLRKFHGKSDSATTRAFEAAHHSAAAVEMLKDFYIGPAATNTFNTTEASTKVVVPTAAAVLTQTSSSRRPRWMQKLFTTEDPIGIHKYLGVFCLLHFIVRFAQMLVGDPSAGWGTRLGRGPHIGPALCLIPHAALSLTSLIFHTGECGLGHHSS